ncbi:MOSC domain-containing protein [Methylicorpusculum sp.]|uniref:MOSC domain-containing protein n=1 Tax=Methylicorpusculum sp. TaxID=2713644 RepID=UPI00271D40AF|nr:MOSC N-terminal beta barrel domain-containing protein [Methylicorpusculum sp.]MDO8845460.1 MOSC domain-containing protein [Methylicorpusculum sp.]MDO9240112.1 MOSC domain-containing protein [Methylicorpusculum sp.]MDP2177257.1 MOSC domain-containing protein [Methylicorpusculum sp.]MDP3531182.1 MOSC domain-containing protein [Methylicorpusculum sp.]MDZ4154470.1 MOSC domain-containing protein [Methylicorpusculum sp.]
MHLKSIYVYPVKSLSGFSVKSWPVNEKGLLHDRRWMIVDTENRFITQRQFPKMSLISTSLSKEGLHLSAASMPPITVPFESDPTATFNVEIWNDSCSAKPASETANNWLSTFLETDCRLVYQPEDAVRVVDPDYGKPKDKIYFSDGFPFLIISEASLAALNQEMNETFSMTRFRPNLVVTDCEPYAEDTWRTIRIGAIDFRLPKPCSRCSITTIDPSTGQQGKEPLATLNRTRKWNKQVFFGQNALHDKTGELHIDDALIVLTQGPKQPPLI